MTLGYYTGPVTSESANSSVTRDTTHQAFQLPCPVGSYCVGGERFVCPGGRFGSTALQSVETCDGPCAAGYFCPANSTSPTAQPCGNDTVYCPIGVAAPVPAPLGEYTVGPSPSTRNGTRLCVSGNYCQAGVSTPCPAGQFGCADRLYGADCNGPCASGYYCPAGSVSVVAHPCGGNASTPNAAAYFCPGGSGAPTLVSTGYYSTGSSESSPELRSGQALCLAGSYCVNGLSVSRLGRASSIFIFAFCLVLSFNVHGAGFASTA